MATRIDIEWIRLHLALWRARVRAHEADYIREVLDEALKYEIGRPFKFGPLQVESPADSEKDRYEAVQVPEKVAPDSRPGHSTEEGQPSSREVTRYREILQRNPTDEQKVFDAFRVTLQSLCNGPLRDMSILRNRQFGPDLIEQVSKWIAQKEAQYTAETSTAAPARAAGFPRRIEHLKSLADFLTVEDKQALAKRIGNVVANATPKQMATVIRALSDMGAINVVTGQYSSLCEAMGREKQSRDIARYITGDRAKSITQADVETAKNNLTLS